MPVDYRKYAPDWPAIRAAILERAKHRCEKCGVPNYAVGYRDQDGGFVPAAGNGPADAAGGGQAWPSLEPLTHAEAREFCEVYNDCWTGKRRTDWEGHHWFVVVLTIAHLDQDPANNDPANLRAYCQLHHLQHDAKQHGHNAAATRAKRKRDKFARGAIEPLAL